MRYQGKITKWKDDQGFGFITPRSGDKDIFVHIKSFSNRQRRPAANESVTFELKIDTKDRLCAENVMFVGEQIQSKTSSKEGESFPILVIIFLGLLLALVFIGKLPIDVLLLYFIASIITFGVYAWDKSAAKNDQWRTRESTLHFFALIGGWPGALIAQKRLQHKSKKQSFQNIFFATVALNCGFFIWLLMHL